MRRSLCTFYVALESAGAYHLLMMNATAADRLAIAQEILRQLGHGTMYMLGAKDVLSLDRGVQFKVQGSRKANVVRISLDADDTYSVEILKCELPKFNRRTGDFTDGRRDVVFEGKGIYVDALHRTIEQHTGLATRL